MRMTRYWMTGCMALVLVVAGRMPTRDETEDEREGGQGARITLTSRYDAAETARQIERSARRNGVPVVLRTAVKQPGEARDEHVTQVLVLGDEARQTPVMQAEGQAVPQLPWSVVIRPLPDGQAVVSLTDPQALAAPEGVSAGMLDKLRRWPHLVRAAIA